MNAEEVLEIGIDPTALGHTVDYLEAHSFGVLAEVDAAGVQGSGPLDGSTWIAVADAASALRDAAEWALMLQPTRARSLLHRAGLLFERIGLDYGFFLAASSVGRLTNEQLELVDARAEHLQAAQPENERDRPPPTDFIAPRNPQQLTYLLMTAAASDNVRERLGPGLHTYVEESELRFGAVPVGALGTPIRDWWAIAERMLRRESPDSVRR
ncbi:MAG: hypothetical protein AAFY28_16050, partial [Actinomycetota bacterium]